MTTTAAAIELTATTSEDGPGKKTGAADGGGTAMSSEGFAAAGSVFGVLFMVAIVVAGKLHWGEDAPLCLVPAEVPFQDYTRGAINSSDYPNPRCPSLTTQGGRFAPDTTEFMHCTWRHNL